MSRLPHLVEATWLASRLEDQHLRIFDCTTRLVPPDPGTDMPYKAMSGRGDYDQAHIPGAGFLEVQGELSDRDSPLLFSVPDADDFAAAMSRHGVSEGTFVVLYSAGTPAWATRVWWLLKLFGFDDVAVLDGGWEHWVEAGLPVSQEPAAYAPAEFRARPRRHLLAAKGDVLRVVGDDSTTLVNTLSEEVFSGTSPSKYGRPGRIPSSVSLPYTSLLDDEGTGFRSVTECAAVLASELGGTEAATPIVTYCGSGITASLVDFVLAGLGRQDLRIYDGSLSEWAPDEALPLERG